MLKMIETKKNLKTIVLGLNNQYAISEKELIMCPYPNKEAGLYTVVKMCGLVNIKEEKNYCQPQKIEECKLIYGDKQ